MGKAESNTFDIDSFGEIIDNFLKENPVQVLITMGRGTLDPDIKDNTGLGPVGRFYILLHAITKALNDLMDMRDKDGDTLLDPRKKEQLVDGILELVKNNLMDEEG